MNSIISVEAVLFDLDGTLVDTAADFVYALNYQRSIHQLEHLESRIIRDTVSDGARALTQLAFGGSEGETGFELKRLELLELYAECAGNQATLFGGMEDTLQYFEAQQIPWGIVTNKPRRFTDILLNKMGLSARSAVTLCPDDVSKSKPDPESLFLACKRLSCLPEHTVYVGDHERDIIAGKAASMKTVAARYGYIHNKNDISNWQADFEINHPQELISLFNISNT